MFAFARVRLLCDELGPVLGAIEDDLSSALPGLAPLAEECGVALADALASGRRMFGPRPEHATMRPRITAKWGLVDAASASGAGEAGHLSAEWRCDADESVRTWSAGARWGPQIDRHWVELAVDLSGDIGNVVRQRHFADAILGLLSRTIDRARALFAYASVSDWDDEPRRRLYSFNADDARRGVFGYSWMTWVPPSLASRIDLDQAQSSGTLLDLQRTLSGGCMVVADQLPLEMSDADLARHRDVLAPVLVPARFGTGALVVRRRSATIPSELCADDWPTPDEPVRHEVLVGSDDSIPTARFIDPFDQRAPRFMRAVADQLGNVILGEVDGTMYFDPDRVSAATLEQVVGSLGQPVEQENSGSVAPSSARSIALSPALEPSTVGNEISLVSGRPTLRFVQPVDERASELLRLVTERYEHAIVDGDHESIVFDDQLVTLDDLRQLVAETERGNRASHMRPMPRRPQRHQP